MEHHSFSVDFGDDILLATGLSPTEFSREARFLLAAKLYEMGKLSSGKAAKLCARDRVDFLLSLADVGVKVSNLSADDVIEELAFARAQ